MNLVKHAKQVIGQESREARRDTEHEKEGT
jgi:hypothetical protein